MAILFKCKKWRDLLSGPITEVTKILHGLVVGKILLHTGENPSEARRWRMSAAPSKNSWGLRGAAPNKVLQLLPSFKLGISISST